VSASSPGNVSSSPLVHRLKNQASAEYEYDREQALRVYHAINGEIPAEGYSPYNGYRDADYKSDDDRIVELFELLNESLFGDVIFGSLATDDQWSELRTQREDE
jgi:hypothetical protein